MIGGKCPDNEFKGFHQKSGQCWIDSTVMVLIYGGDTSDIIIKGIMESDENLVENKIRTNLKMLPINVEKENYEDFIQFGKNYVQNLKDRLVQTLYLPQKDREPEFLKLVRRASRVFSLQCEIDAKQGSNINIISKKNYYKTGGYLYDIIWLVSFFNFLFLNEHKYIIPVYIDADEENNFHLDEGASHIENPNFIGYLVTFEANEDDYHQIGMFRCKNQDGIFDYWIYDNNGFAKRYEKYGQKQTFKNIDWKQILEKDGYDLNLKHFFDIYKLYNITEIIALYTSTDNFNEVLYYTDTDLHNEEQDNKYLGLYGNARTIKIRKKILDFKLIKKLRTEQDKLSESYAAAHNPSDEQISFFGPMEDHARFSGLTRLAEEKITTELERLEENKRFKAMLEEQPEQARAAQPNVYKRRAEENIEIIDDEIKRINTSLKYLTLLN